MDKGIKDGRNGDDGDDANSQLGHFIQTKTEASFQQTTTNNKDERS